jgi:hypothetical protein
MVTEYETYDGYALTEVTIRKIGQDSNSWTKGQH